jgi:uncharacterized protein YbbK (DUF523 family)
MIRPDARGVEYDEEIRIGISACLLGEEVRFDGSHKRDRFIVGTLGEFFRFVPVCPELDIGLGVPRESLRLVRRGAEIRIVAPKSDTDHTETMVEYSKAKSTELGRLDLSGYLLKRAFPSCGMERVRVCDSNGVPDKSGRGIFARVLLGQHPLLPVEEEGACTIRESARTSSTAFSVTTGCGSSSSPTGRAETWCGSTPERSTCCSLTSGRATMSSGAW